jgi:hypothetical protein
VQFQLRRPSACKYVFCRPVGLYIFVATLSTFLDIIDLLADPIPLFIALHDARIFRSPQKNNFSLSILFVQIERRGKVMKGKKELVLRRPLLFVGLLLSGSSAVGKEPSRQGELMLPISTFDPNS